MENERRNAVFIAVLVAVMGVLTSIGATLITSNRQEGVTGVKIEELQKGQTRMENKMEKVDDKLQHLLEQGPKYEEDRINRADRDFNRDRERPR